MRYYYQLDTFNRFIRIGLVKEDEINYTVWFNNI